MSAPTFGDAKARALVTITRPGRPTVTGRLLYLPSTDGRTRRSPGTRARVKLPSGSIVSVPPETLSVAA